MKNNKKTIAYFSMEFAVSDVIPNFSGGLGVLAADLILAAADLNMNVVGITLLYHQHDNPQKAFVPTMMKKMRQQVVIEIEGRRVRVAIWKLAVRTNAGKKALIYFLDTNLAENVKQDRDLTKTIYLDDPEGRLGQEMVLGVGGVKALQVLGLEVSNYHLNEGHCSCAILEKLIENEGDIAKTRRQFTFTTHTPVAAGHDYFNYDIVERLMGELLPENIRDLSLNEVFGMTQLALNMSAKTNSVSVKHRAVCREMFPTHKFVNITNGIYHPRWVSERMKKMLNKYLNNWHSNPSDLSVASEMLPDIDLRRAHGREKEKMISWINENRKNFPLVNFKKSDLLENDILTIAFARRIVPYKRTDLIFRNLNRLLQIGDGKIQLIFAGNPRVNDEYYNSVIGNIKKSAEFLRGHIKVAFINKYNLEIAKRLLSGTDIWLNTPVIGNEASGTSGMKAALNGAINISSADGWWLEAMKMDKKCGWQFGGGNGDDADDEELLDAIEEATNCYYKHPEQWLNKMKRSIALLSHFNAHRAVREYCEKMWQ